MAQLWDLKMPDTDLEMGEIDHKAKFCGHIKPAQWWRYRDDIFDLRQQGHDALEPFTEYINSLCPTIKFEQVYCENNLIMFCMPHFIWLPVLFKLMFTVSLLIATYIFPPPVPILSIFLGLSLSR